MGIMAQRSAMNSRSDSSLTKWFLTPERGEERGDNFSMYFKEQKITHQCMLLTRATTQSGEFPFS